MQRSDAGVLSWHSLPAALPAPPEKSRSCSLPFCPFPAQETLANSEFPLLGTHRCTCTPCKTAGEALARMAQRQVGYGALTNPPHPPQLSFFPSLFNAGGDGDGPKAVAVLSCSLRNAPCLTGIALLSWHGPPGSQVLTFSMELPRLVHASQAGAISCWILHGLLRQVPRLWQRGATCTLGKHLIMVCRSHSCPSVSAFSLS